MKPLLLILGHMMRDETVRDPIFKESMNEILRHGVNHMNMMLEVTMEINKAAQTGMSRKKLGWRAIQSIIEFQQLFVQGMWATNDPMLQLPGVTDDVIKSYRKKLREHQIPDGKLETFCRLHPNQRSVLELFSAEEGSQFAKM